MRLATKGAGKWATSGGENAKFGLSTADLVSASNTLKEAGLAHCLKLVHFHVGSQVPDIGTIKRAVREAARFYAKLLKMGHEMGYHRCRRRPRRRLRRLAHRLRQLDELLAAGIRARHRLEHHGRLRFGEGRASGDHVSESGRAIVAHHSVLVVEAFGAIEKDRGGGRQPKSATDDPKQVTEILDIQRNLTQQNRMEGLHDAQQIKEQAQSMFDLGLLDLEAKAKVETVFWQIAQRIVEFCAGMKYVPEEVKELETALGDQYVCNFSVFQSLLDHWALGQLFPVMPIHRLNEFPDRQATLVDITCDSDGKVSKFIDLQDVKDTLPLHKFKPGEPYYLGFFLMGAYQDIMGDLHNLFGRVNEVHVFLDDDEESGWYIEETIDGSTIGEVLSMTQWDKNELIRQVKVQVDAAIKSDRLKPNEAMRLLASYERGAQRLHLSAVQRPHGPNPRSSERSAPRSDGEKQQSTRAPLKSCDGRRLTVRAV